MKYQDQIPDLKSLECDSNLETLSQQVRQGSVNWKRVILHFGTWPILIGKNVLPGDTTDSQNNCPISKNAITRMKRFVKFK